MKNHPGVSQEKNTIKGMVEFFYNLEHVFISRSCIYGCNLSYKIYGTSMITTTIRDFINKTRLIYGK